MKRNRQSRHRKDRIGPHLGASARLIAGVSCLVPFLFLSSLAFKALLVVYFAFFALLAGKRLRWGYFAVLLLSVTFFHLLSPLGRVLFELGPFKVTTGALEDGLVRGLSLIGMVFLSVASVRPELNLPGGFGGLLGRTFRHFDRLFEGRRRLGWKDFLPSLDKLLMERFNPEADDFGLGETDPEDRDEALVVHHAFLSSVLKVLAVAVLPMALLAYEIFFFS